jgi:hypothetical protein
MTPTKKLQLTDEMREWFRAQGEKGGSIAAANMTKKARKARAKKAIMTRWAKVRKEAAR